MVTSIEPHKVALDSVAAGTTAPIPSLGGLLEGVAGALLQRSSVAKSVATLTAELGRIGLGQSTVVPERGDWRFRDPTWTSNGVYRRVAQAYLVACAAVDRVVDDLEDSGDPLRAERARFAFGIIKSAVAPTNTLIGNPAALKRTLETGGANLIAGATNLVQDLRHNGGMPSTTKRGALAVGVDLGVTPGQVIDQDEFAELLQYAPSTKKVKQRPVLVVPPPIGRYYFLDLAPGRSFVEYAVSRGLQTFLLSWRNPGPEQGDWNIDTYAQRIITAVAAIREVTASEDVNVIGFCAGGILNTAVLNHLAAKGDQSIHSVTYGVTMLDFGQSAPIGAFASARLLSVARWRSSRQGVITARAMGQAFTWMRPNDLVWNYWVNNYLMGEDPPVFDILAWNADGTNLAGALHQQFLDIFEHNSLVHPGELTALGTPLDLASIALPTYVLGAVNDHLTPWKSTFQTTDLLSGDCTFVLSNAGHIASLVNPPGNSKASYFTGTLQAGDSSEQWRTRAEKQTGSWWEHWADWVLERGGEDIPGPRELGSERFPALAPAPGSYVRQST